MHGLIKYWAKKSLGKLQHKLLYLGVEEPKPRISVLPYLSGDAFLAIADVAIMRQFSSPVVLRNRKKILFVEIELLEKPEVLEYSSNFYSVIAHNGDHKLSQNVIETLNDLGVQLFATNVISKIPGVHTIPIGIENLHHRRNGSIHYYNPINISSLSYEKELDLLASFSVATNAEVRGPLENELKQAGYTNKNMSISEYRSKLEKSAFVISPPGNGVDCHRTWEAFYHKTVPVVEKQHWYFENHRLPILVVDKFKDFIQLSDGGKLQLYESIIQNQYYEAIYFDYWLSFINNKNLLFD